MIREARQEDLPQILELIHTFHAEALNNYGMYCDDDVAGELMPKLVATSLVMEVDGRIVGVIGGFHTTHIVNKRPLYQEMIWYVLPEYRGEGDKLLDALEDMCRRNGVYQIIAGHMGDRKLKAFERFYRNRGYKLLEVQYLKQLEGRDANTFEPETYTS